ncbi:hypothetical protein [uncultured Mucilaginibacter sp.]|uniref:hypothetical protein n=1 Tax=uncultured Mucilaginibacter sp. TaxID=797541 RepID=UPI0025FBA4DF|nr:hypothetical protein [uncultured Mucilaginibacter sp.]
MKKLTLITLLTFSTLLTYAQYGKLQPVKPGDTVMIIRTPKAVLQALLTNQDAIKRKDATLIEQIEETLEDQRKAYLTDKLSPYNGELAGWIAVLQREGLPDVKYYIKEFTLYKRKV